ncbi:MAG: hypothetical protein HPY72_03190 [Anaerolineae bacterium]|nr:hypothetical protein [Anaerolineae bacterium]
MKNAFKFMIKAYFGGCIGCFGALSFLLILLLIIGVVLGPSFIYSANSIVQSLNHSLNQIISQPGLGSPNTNIDMGNLPVFEVFLTKENNPDAVHIDSFAGADYKNTWFWVRAPKGQSMDFNLLLTMPDRGQVQFGPTFKTDPTGNPVSCGQFGDTAPQPGKYKLEVQLTGTSVTVGEVEFEVIAEGK